jgi:hypothetical protein
MYAVVRRYAGASSLIDTITRRQDEVRQLISSVPGFVTYHGIRSGDQLVTVSVCRDRAGADETTRRAADWVRQQLPADQSLKPEVVGGDVFLDFSAAAPSAGGYAADLGAGRPADVRPSSLG